MYSKTYTENPPHSRRWNKAVLGAVVDDKVMVVRDTEGADILLEAFSLLDVFREERRGLRTVHHVQEDRVLNMTTKNRAKR